MGKYKYFRYFAYLIELLIFFMVQETPGLVPELFGARPVILIPVALAISMFENETVGMFFGLFCGLLIDFGAGGTLGFHGLLLSAVCYGIGLITANLVQTNFLTAMLIAIVTTAALCILHWLFFFVFFGYEHVVYALVSHYIPRFFYTIAITPIIYYFTRALALQIRAKEE